MSVISENTLNEILQEDIAERILKRILLSSTMRLLEIVQFEANERLLNAFNNAAAFISDTDDYTASICVCVEILSILRYKINNTRPTLNELMLIITELRNVHEGDEGRVCLEHWRKVIFLTSAILRSLSLSSFSKIIVSQETWTSPAMIRKNNRFFHEKIIKNYINMIIERFVNAFDEFVNKIKRIDMTVFDINVYWNVTPNTSVASSSTFKSFILISGFATFRSFKKLDVNTRMRSQSAERSKRIAQQTFEKLNLKRSRVESSSDQLIKDWRRKQWFWWFRKRDCLFEVIVRTDCMISWRLFIVVKGRSLTERETCVTRWILLFLYYSCGSYTELVFHSEVSYILQLS